jgi:DNA-binding PadR family transcriptional regulator
MGPGTLYSTIQRLVNLELVEETTHQKNPAELERRQRFYRLTALGRRVFDLEETRPGLSSAQTSYKLTWGSPTCALPRLSLAQDWSCESFVHSMSGPYL